jgi:pantoate--beta-alanine ligase
MLEANGCDLVFLPEVDTIYPPGHSVFVELNETVDAPSIGMEGEFRPGHFRGVATVVAQLFNLVQPHLAVFGEKDAQQLAVVRQLVRDLHFDIEIVGHPTVREPDGLAMSSRNAYLSAEQRLAATRIHRTLEQARTRIEQGERNANTIRQEIRESLGREPLFEVNYAEVVDATTFRPVERIAGEVVLPVAVEVGRTRLLDNVRIQTAGVRQQTSDNRVAATNTKKLTSDV